MTSFSLLILYKGFQGAALGKGYFSTYKLTESLLITTKLVFFSFTFAGYFGPLKLNEFPQNKARKVLLTLTGI